jgi:hypothetical protein
VVLQIDKNLNLGTQTRLCLSIIKKKRNKEKKKMGKHQIALQALHTSFPAQTRGERRIHWAIGN